MKIQSTYRSGFTLIELLTAVTITVSLLAVLIGTTQMSMDTWSESRDRARAATQAKEGIDVIARDLENAVIRGDNDFEWLYVKMDSNGDQLGPNAAEIKNPIEMGFLAAATDRYDGDLGGSSDEGGDISNVVYRLVYKDQFGDDKPVYSLYRMLTNPDDTFEDFLGQQDLDTNVDSDAVIDSSNFIAENIYNLSVTLIVEYTDGDELRRKRVSVIDGSKFTEVSVTGAGLKDGNGSDLVAGHPDARIVSVELGMVVLNDSAMKALGKKKFNDKSFREMLRENSNYFTKSVLVASP